MLFKQIHLKGIKKGAVSLAFRKWKTPRVRKGSIIKTAVGQIEIQDISEIELENISPQDALNAGHENLSELTNLLNSRKEGNLYKIWIKYHSPDPRIELRNQTELAPEEIEKIKSKLGRFDKYSKEGNWTLQVLKAIKENPKLKALELAKKTGRQKDWLKLNIRKLKNLGLTISHQQGYTLSPRGKIVLEQLTK